MKQDTIRANAVLSPKVHKLIHAAAVDRGQPLRNPEFHLYPVHFKAQTFSYVSR